MNLITSYILEDTYSASISMSDHHFSQNPIYPIKNYKSLSALPSKPLMRTNHSLSVKPSYSCILLYMYHQGISALQDLPGFPKKKLLMVTIFLVSISKRPCIVLHTKKSYGCLYPRQKNVTMLTITGLRQYPSITSDQIRLDINAKHTSFPAPQISVQIKCTF